MGFVVAVSCTSGEGKGGGGGGGGTSSERKNERKGENESRAWPINHTFGVYTDRSLKARNDERTEGRREGGLSLGNEVEESIRHASTSTPFAKQR
ncbi:hypothetical protein ALC57_06715 [Trachymyrmex cornetzi]|uniref:Uncharacterized protein n=1 Tax=Trachymyrmex cornetzi TaxID=471704 RepID=A0A195E7K0_9HYME|nr:hypothetical protein ALC57_06715 [Trachymyrmex cornetzi]